MTIPIYISAMALSRGKDTAVIGVLEPCISGSLMTDEQKLLAEFVQKLNSYYSIAEHDSEDVDENNIREQAQLLMSLSSLVSNGPCTGANVESGLFTSITRFMKMRYHGR